MPGTSPPQVTIGVDTHADMHVAVALDQDGRRLGAMTIPTTQEGYDSLLDWASQLGDVETVGIEGTGTFGSGLSRHLRNAGLRILDVDRPDRRARRTRGKTDETDAEIAARATLSGSLHTKPKSADGHVESLRMLRVAKRSALKARTQAANQLHALVVTAPEPLRAELRDLSVSRLVTVASSWRVTRAINPLAAGKLAIRSVARRHSELSREIHLLELEMARLALIAAPTLLALPNVGPDTAAALLIAAGDNPDRLRSESSFAHLCGTAPLPASSGKSHRHRLNRGGNRDANSALYTIVLGRLYRHEPTRAYVARRTAEGRSKREIVRCLKRYVAREVFAALMSSSTLRPASGPGAGGCDLAA